MGPQFREVSHMKREEGIQSSLWPVSLLKVLSWLRDPA